MSEIDLSSCEDLYIKEDIDLSTGEIIKEYICTGMECGCDEVNNCYYKQLQQLKQKLERIKEICNQNKYGGPTYDWTDVLEDNILQIIESEE